MRENLKVSVVMSVYEKEKSDFLEKSIESLLKQTKIPNEIVIVKDGVLGKGLNDILEKYEKTYPDLFNIISLKKNGGLGKALNIGIKNSKNDIIARMDSDDICFPSRFEEQINEFKKDDNLSIVGSWVDEFDSDIEKVISTRKVPVESNEILKFSKKRSPFNHPTVMFKKQDVLEVGGYSELRRNQDVDLFGRMIFKGLKAKNIGKSLLWFRTNEKLVRRRKSWENTESYIRVIYKLKKIGHSTWGDVIIVTIAQIGMFILPAKLQKCIYKLFLRR